MVQFEGLEGIDDEFGFAPILAHHLSLIDDSDRDVEELYEKFDGPVAVISYSSILKSKRNSLYRSKDCNNAYLKYNKAMKCLCISIPVVCDSISYCRNYPVFRELAISIQLNLAACALKLFRLRQAIELCSLILGVDETNVKANFRGLAYAKLGNLKEACEDLMKARELEPNDREIIRELSNLEIVLSEGLVMKKKKIEKHLGPESSKNKDQGSLEGQLGGPSNEGTVKLKQKGQAFDPLAKRVCPSESNGSGHVSEKKDSPEADSGMPVPKTPEFAMSRKEKQPS
ncbi:hypothetical protein SOVF_026800 [Spinacia oleracea]|nr:hypothetical protein SOVF_026800 [Spinacia oleracea]